MSEWGWVTFAYLVAYGSMALFALSISLRIRSARSKLEGVAEEPQ